MSKETNKILDDITKITSNAAGVLSESGKAFQAKVREQVKHALEDLEFVSRDEFEIVKLMAEKAREENETLKKKLEELEKKPSSSSSKSKSKSSSTSKTTSKKNSK
jgi:hypothetical protein